MKLNRKMFDKLYDNILARWPSSIDVSDKTLYEDGAALIPALNDIHDKISEKLESELMDDSIPDEYYHWNMMIDWEIRVIVKESAKVSDIVYPYKIDREEVLMRCLDNESFMSYWVNS